MHGFRDGFKGFRDRLNEGFKEGFRDKAEDEFKDSFNDGSKDDIRAGFGDASRDDFRQWTQQLVHVSRIDVAWIQRCILSYIRHDSEFTHAFRYMDWPMDAPCVHHHSSWIRNI